MANDRRVILAEYEEAKAVAEARLNVAEAKYEAAKGTDAYKFDRDKRREVKHDYEKACGDFVHANRTANYVRDKALRSLPKTESSWW